MATGPSCVPASAPACTRCGGRSLRSSTSSESSLNWGGGGGGGGGGSD